MIAFFILYVHYNDYKTVNFEIKWRRFTIKVCKNKCGQCPRHLYTMYIEMVNINITKIIKKDEYLAFLGSWGVGVELLPA